MRKTIFQYSKKITSQGLYDSLSSSDKKIIDNHRTFLLGGCSEIKAEEDLREILRLREVIGKGLDKITKEDYDYFRKELKQSSFGDNTKNKIKDSVKRFLRQQYKDWSERFGEFRDFKTNTDAERIKPITSKTIFTKADIKKLLDSEPSLFWKTFLIVQYEGGLRTGEVRKLTWDKVTFEDDGFVVVKIVSKKNRNGTAKERLLPLKDSAVYLEKLREQQETAKTHSRWVFPSPQDPNKHISKAVNLWFSKLTEKVLGRACNNYLLRHTKVKELKELINSNVMPKENATAFMGHSEKMFDKAYAGMKKEDVKELMKKQIYNFDYMPPEKKHQLEKDVSDLRELVGIYTKIIEKKFPKFTEDVLEASGIILKK